MFSGANLALQIVLARRSSPDAYGAFAVAFAAYLLAGGFHQSLFLEPMSVLGARRTGEDARAYVAGLVVLHFRLTVPLGLALAGLALVPGLLPAAFAGPLLGLGVALPLSLLCWLARAACYLAGRPAAALLASGTYASCLLAALAAWPSGRPMQPLHAFLLLGGAGVAGAAVAGRLLRVRGSERADSGALLREHWAYGRWIAAATLATGISTLAVFPLLALVAGTAQSGALRALTNLVTPHQQVLGAAFMLALPRLSRHEAAAPAATFRRTALLLVGVTILGSAAYAAALLAAGPWVLRVLYRSAFYAGLAWALPLQAITLVVFGVTVALGMVLRARRRPDAVMWAKAAGALTMLAVGWPAARAGLLQGALVALLASTLVEAAVLLAAWLRDARRVAGG